MEINSYYREGVEESDLKKSFSLNPVVVAVTVGSTFGHLSSFTFHSNSFGFSRLSSFSFRIIVTLARIRY